MWFTADGFSDTLDLVGKSNTIAFLSIDLCVSHLPASTNERMLENFHLIIDDDFVVDANYKITRCQKKI